MCGVVEGNAGKRGGLAALRTSHQPDVGPALRKQRRAATERSFDRWPHHGLGGTDPVSMHKHESGAATDMAVEIGQSGTADHTPLGSPPVRRAASLGYDGRPSRHAMPICVSCSGQKPGA